MGDLDVHGRPGGRHTAGLDRAGVPAMPDIGPSERVTGVPHPVADGINPTIGWQFRPRAKGGPAFMIIRRSGLGTLKVVEAFPLTEEGWASAWQSLIKQNPSAAPKLLAALQSRQADAARFKALEMAGLSPSGSQQGNDLYTRSLVTLHDVVFLGGYVPGSEIVAGQRYDVSFLEDRFLVVARPGAQVLAEVPYNQVEDVEIGGPGIVRTGGGFVGGGFGATGAIEGMAIASVLNGLTSRTSVKTIVPIQGTGCELFLLHTRVPPEQLRIELSRPLGAIRVAQAADAVAGTQPRAPAESVSPVEELTKLAGMLEKGLLTREEFDLMKAKLLGLPT